MRNPLIHWLGGGFLIGVLAVLLLGASSPTLYTPWTAFKGTNGTSIKTNPASPVVIVDASPGVIIASNSLVAQISAAQVWTNDGTFYFPKTNRVFSIAIPTGTIRIGAYTSNYNAWFGNDADDYTRLGMLDVADESNGDQPHREHVLFSYTDPTNWAGVQSEVDNHYLQIATALSVNGVVSQFFFNDSASNGEFGHFRGSSTAWDFNSSIVSTRYLFNSIDTINSATTLLALQNHATNIWSLDGSGMVKARTQTNSSTLDVAGLSTFFGGMTGVGTGTNTGNFYVGGTLGIGAGAISDAGSGNLTFQGGIIDTWLKTTGDGTNGGNFYSSGITNNGTNFSSGGFASYSTLATNAVTATGVTNTAALDRQVFVSATATSFTINDRSGAVLYTSPTLTATLNIRLQSGWSVRAASGLVGTVIP